MKEEATERDKKTIADLRKEANITQFELAVKSGISLSTIVNAERGIRIPRTDKAIKIAQVLGVSVEDIQWGK